MITIKEPPNLRQAHAHLPEFKEQALPHATYMRKVIATHHGFIRNLSLGTDLTHPQQLALVRRHHRNQTNTLMLRAILSRTLKGRD